MILSVTSDNPLQRYYLKDLNNTEYQVQLDTWQNLPTGWYEFIVEYVDTKIEITDIKINQASIEHMLYTGYVTDGSGNLHQPATAVWDKGTVFSIWIHTEIGFMYHRILETIRNGDFGQNLFINYTFTVDRPYVTQAHKWPEHLRSFYQHAHGPQWWQKVDTPWKIIDIPDFDTNVLISEIRSLTKYRFEKQNGGYIIEQLTEHTSELPLIEINDIPSQIVQDFLKSVGYVRILDIAVNTLKPGAYIDIHRDDHFKSTGYEYIKGCKKLYWACENHAGVYFKNGRGGILPLDKPLLVNTVDYPHAVIHEGDSIRTSILVYGELPS